MTIATFKKKTMAKYNNHTVNNNQKIVLFSRGAGDNKQNVFTGPTSAFTLNGKVRSRSYIGKTYQMSNRPGKASNYCCADSSQTVKPTVFTAKEVMRGKKLWKKRTFTRSEIPAEYEMPSQGQLQHICNNWVMVKENNGGSMSNTANTDSGSQGMYVDHKASKEILCSLKSNITSSRKCSTNSSCPNSRIGGKLLPLANTMPFTKNISKGNPYSSGMYTRINSSLKSNKSHVGYNKPFPFRNQISSYETCGVNYLQANDNSLLSTYYKDQNNVPSICS